ncbi:protein of unknown function [Clostridium cavendishii DSM 21758]|uniref:DUF4397 domain-containing protein n=1 Tax=Clostridium cavendishii DSM 21758 TaxID=1121302 RepID=A0A1M6CQC3_9CLOT|nr:DUF4397 domain-containing protein [Clostridium cavendishii]SHI63227.1 protein of unknown function [Clostridium cavendishii DSM 21758]
MYFNDLNSTKLALFRPPLPYLNSNLRFLHAIPSDVEIDIYINNTLTYENLHFGEVSNYISVTPGESTLTVYKAGTKENPILNAAIDTYPNNYQTLAFINPDSNIELQLIQDGMGSLNPSISFLRYIQFSPNAPLLDLGIFPNRRLFKYVEYKEETGYRPISAGIYEFLIYPSNATGFKSTLPNTKLELGTFYTIYSIGMINETPTFTNIIVKDGV